MFYCAAKLKIIKTPSFTLRAVRHLIPLVKHISGNSWPGMGSFYTLMNGVVEEKLINVEEKTFGVM